MKRAVFAAALCVALATGPAQGDPDFRLSYPGGVPRAEISGDWRHSHYTVWRAPAASGPFALISDSDVLCTGPCFADDFSAVPGRTYFYRFDLVLAQGGSASFGPYTAAISPTLARPLSASILPNPGAGPARVLLFAAGPLGGTTAAEASLFDLQGRRVATLFGGPLAFGTSRINWDGRGDDGRPLAGGVYLLRLAASDGRRYVTRVVRGR
jgi:hypothetical protein